jgi:hypothetical protein
MEGENQYQKNYIENGEFDSNKPSTDNKKKTPKEVIEGTSSPHLEHAFIKYPGSTVKGVVSRQEGTSVKTTIANMELSEHKDKRYTFIHTHPFGLPPITKTQRVVAWLNGYSEADIRKEVETFAALHSGADLQIFLYRDNMKCSTIAVRNTETGELIGYNVLAKTKNTPKSPMTDDEPAESIFEMLKFKLGVGKMSDDTNEYENSRMKSLKEKNPSFDREAYDKFLSKYHLRSRLVPAEGYQVNKWGTSFERKMPTESKE